LKTSKKKWDGLCGMFETKHDATKMFFKKLQHEDVEHVNNFKSMVE
jgi:hypothetical protein